MIHHAVTPNRAPEAVWLQELNRAFALARQIQAAHQARRWADSGHHFLISRGGVIVEGRHGSHAAAQRGRVVQGAHAGVNRINARHFGIELEGTYHEQYLVTEPQWAALVEWCAWLAFWGGFDTQRIEGHRYFKATLCPGLVAERLPALRAAAHGRKWALVQEA